MLVPDTKIPYRTLRLNSNATVTKPTIPHRSPDIGGVFFPISQFHNSCYNNHMKEPMENKIAQVFKRTKKVLAKIKERQGFPMHWNSIMICINSMGHKKKKKVPFKLNDLDDDKIFDYFVKHVEDKLFYYPAEDRISKKTFAAFIESLDPSLVDTKESPPDFAEDLFLQYYDPLEDWLKNGKTL
jgi:hypothetical protein